MDLHVPALVAASLLGSLHCAGMCGGLVAFAVGAEPNARGPMVAYHLGRLAIYTALGAIAGHAGRLIDLAGGLAGFQRPAAVAAGLVMVLWGAMTLLRHAGWRPSFRTEPYRRGGVSVPLMTAYSRALGQVRAWPANMRAGAIGLCSALLPCGWLYAFVAAAAGTGSALQGSLAMAAFWLGTLPLLVMLGVGVKRLAGPLMRWVPVATAVLLLAVGLHTVVARALLPAPLPDAAEVCHGR